MARYVEEFPNGTIGRAGSRLTVEDTDRGRKITAERLRGDGSVRGSDVMYLTAPMVAWLLEALKS